VRDPQLQASQLSQPSHSPEQRISRRDVAMEVIKYLMPVIGSHGNPPTFRQRQCVNLANDIGHAGVAF
jgi:hypothetical protein